VYNPSGRDPGTPEPASLATLSGRKLWMVQSSTPTTSSPASTGSAATFPPKRCSCAVPGPHTTWYSRSAAPSQPSSREAAANPGPTGAAGPSSQGPPGLRSWSRTWRGSVSPTGSSWAVSFSTDPLSV
jgi:hypothetical protein